MFLLKLDARDNVLFPITIINCIIKNSAVDFRLANENQIQKVEYWIAKSNREIQGYDFNSATKDFYDARLYLDYHF